MWWPVCDILCRGGGNEGAEEGKTCRYRLKEQISTVIAPPDLLLNSVTSSQSDGAIKGGRELLIQLQHKELVCC